MPEPANQPKYSKIGSRLVTGGSHGDDDGGIEVTIVSGPDAWDRAIQ